MRLRSMIVPLVLLVLLAAVAASSASAATVCNADICVITGGYAGLQSDIAASGAPAPVVRLLTSEVALAQALHPPGPCLGACVPSFRSTASEAVLVLVDYQVGALAGLLPRASCPGGCAFPPAAARAIDGDIRAIFADPAMTPPGPPNLPTFIVGNP